MLFKLQPDQVIPFPLDKIAAKKLPMEFVLLHPYPKTFHFSPSAARLEPQGINKNIPLTLINSHSNLNNQYIE